MAIIFLSLIFFLTTLNWPTLVGCSGAAVMVMYFWDFVK